MFGGRNIHRAPFLLAWPQYDPENTLHRELAVQAGYAERVAAGSGGEAGGLAAGRARVRASLQRDGVADRLEALAEELLETPGVDEQL